jgi:hypothetical protein
MDDAQFENWMKQLAAADQRDPAASVAVIQWRARLRRQRDAEERVARPIRTAERAAGISCWVMAAVVAAGMGSGALWTFFAMSAVTAGGLRAITLKGREL